MPRWLEAGLQFLHAYVLPQVVVGSFCLTCVMAGGHETFSRIYDGERQVWAII
jgi:hypothetical protein